MKISVYSDGSSCGRKLGAGGWGWIVVKDNEEILACGYGGESVATNNQMELEAAIQGLNYVIFRDLHIGNEIELVSDSQYVLGLADGSYSPKKNLSRAMELRAAVQKTWAQMRWVKGHSGNVGNELCDRLSKYGKDTHKP